MKKRRFIDNTKIAIIIVVLMLLIQAIEGIPWWIFIVPVIAAGALSAFKKWQVNSFPIGFLAGFIVWFGGNLYFHLSYNGIILKKIGLLLSMSTAGVLLTAGLLGGLITGLALYTGQQILLNNEGDMNA